MSKTVTIPTCQSPFTVMVNDRKYVYPAGETVEVPDEVAHIIETHSHELLPVSGGSGVNEALGTWKFVDDPDLSTMPQIVVPFLVYDRGDGDRCGSIIRSTQGSSDWGIYTMVYDGSTVYTGNPSGSYGISHGWKDEAYKTITILAITDEPHSREFAAWLKANATKIS